MKRTIALLSLLILSTFWVVSAHAQEHQHGQATDTTKAMPPGHEMGPMDHMDAMMRMHERFMADSVLHDAVMRDTSLMAAMHTMMREMTNGETDMHAMRSRMAAMSPPERRQMMTQMHERMMARMKEMSPDDREAMMQRMMEVHRRMMANPAIRERMQADPEMRRMMDHGQMDHGQMDHGQMDHGQMDHGQMDHGGMTGMRNEAPARMTEAEARAAEAASRTADRFHEALANGDRAAVETLLLPDATVLEAGRSEARAEYLGHHFGEDAALLSSVRRTPLTRRTTVAGDAAWVASSSRLTGTHEGRALDLGSAELLILRRDETAPDGWRIAAVHWSSGQLD